MRFWRGLVRLSPAASGNLRIIALLPRVNAGVTAALAVTTLVGTGLGIAFTFAAGTLVGSVPAAVAGGTSSVAAATALRALGVAAALYVLRQIVDPVSGVFARILAQELNQHLEVRVMRAVNAPSGIAHLEDPEVLDLIQAAQEVGSAGYQPGVVVLGLRNLIPFWVQSITYSLILARFHWWIGLGMFAVAYWASAVRRTENVRNIEVLSQQGTLARRTNYLRDLATTPAAAKEVRVFALLEWLTEGFSREWLANMLPFWRRRAAAEWKLAAFSPLTATAHVVAVLALGWSAARGEISLTQLAIFLAAIPGVTNLGTGNADDARMAYGGVAVPAVLRLEALVRGVRESGSLGASAGESRSTELDSAAPRSGIAFERVTFRYPGGVADVLSDFDLFIPAGESLAIVGANGAGKTTIVKLLCGLYQPTAGRIAVDGVDLSDVEPRVWRRRGAAIFQDFVQYQLSARENVALGKSSAARGALDEAARKAGALDVVEALPRGWETVLSREYAGGTNLSGGQWQRIALARALYAVAPYATGNGHGDGHTRGASVLILDEPTANLDVRAEAALYERFLDLTHGLTTIVISHRFSTVRRAGRICVLEDGRVVELGTHDELLAAGGRYATMFRLQAERFDA